jgi:hypothetical protein
MTRALIPIFGGPRPGFYTFEAGTDPRDRTLNPLRVDSAQVRAWIEAREPRAVDHWRELGREEYGRAFTVARTAGHDIVDDIYFALADTFERGGTEVDFARLVIPTLRRKGWLGGNEGQIANRVALIYDANLRLARGAGRWDRYQRTKVAFPYLRGVTARDERVRHPPKSRYSDHRAFDGIILPVEHWFWRKWWTPLGFRCRCSIIQMTRSQLARYAGGITPEAEVRERDERLGEPIFPSPAQPIEVQLASMADATNRERMPGSAWVNPVQTQHAGFAAWDAILAGEAFEGLAELITRLFGRAA